MKDNQVQSRFIELRAQGWSYARIARELDVSKQTLINWSKRHSMEISNLIAIDLEELQERHQLTRAMRIQLLGQELKRLTDELAKRDLSTVPTEKLFDQVLKYLGQARAEVLEPEFQGTENTVEQLERSGNRVTQWAG